MNNSVVITGLGMVTPLGRSPGDVLAAITDRRVAAGPPVGFDVSRLDCPLTERRVKSIFIHAFQDADTFDLARVRRCCNAYPQADGKFIPACMHNVLRRKTQKTGEML